jgi:hypothetical protein
MTFDEFIANPYDPGNILIAVGFVVAGLVLVFVFMYALFFEISGKRPALRLGLLFGSVLALVGLVVFGFHVGIAGSAIDTENKTIAENNLKKKYDMEGVLWADSLANYASSSGRYYIKIQDSDSNILKFRYRVDPETREPYLLNEEGSNAPHKANDLLLKRQELK